jgi:hypothetical protein
MVFAAETSNLNNSHPFVYIVRVDFGIKGLLNIAVDVSGEVL